jgi:hypothetical protein
MKTLDYLIVILAGNVACIGFLILTGWFAYLDNGYWGWPFVAALCTAVGLKSSSEKKKEEREEAIERAKLSKKYGDIFKN